jgi:cytochrome P450 family 6
MEMSFIEQIIEGEFVLLRRDLKLKPISIFSSTHLIETLRIYPPVSDIHRWVSKDYRLPNGSILPSETAVIIPALAFSRDPDLFPDPMRFDPSRFTPEAKAQRHPFSTMPFGEGNRICIGMR